MPKGLTTVTVDVTWMQSQEVNIDVPNYIITRGLSAIKQYIAENMKVPETGHYIDDSLLTHAYYIKGESQTFQTM